MKDHQEHHHQVSQADTNEGVISYLEKIFNSNDFMPHGHCYFWKPEVLWTTVIGDTLTALAYIIIPIVMVLFIRKRTDLDLNKIFYLFAAFIISCGFTHMIDIWTIWTPTYRLQSVLKLLTGIISIFTAYKLILILPEAIKIPSPQQYENELQEKIEIKKLLEVIEKNNKYLKTVNEFISNSTNNIEKDFEVLLQKVTQMLDLKTGIISHIKKNKYMIKHVYNPENKLKVGDEFELGNTYCDITIKEKKLVYINHMSESIHRSHPCFKNFQLESYIGIPLIVNGTLYGTLNFSSDKQRIIFNEPELNLLQFIGDWVSRSIEQYQAEKEIRNKTQLIRAVLEQSPFGIAVVNTKGDVILSNDLVKNILGNNPKGLNKSEISDRFGVFKADTITRVEAYDLSIAKALRGEKNIRERFFIKNENVPEGVFLDVRASTLRDQNKEITGGVVLFENIDEQIKTEKKLALATEEKNKAILHLKKSNKSLEDFAHMTSHDLQEPLATIQGTIEIFELTYTKVLDEEGLVFLDFAKKATNRLRDLIADILEFSKINNSEIKKEKLDVNDLVNSIEADLKTQLSDMNGEVITGNLPSVFASKTHLYLLFKNLISNGLKYNESDKPIININAIQNEKKWTFSVQDNGIGIEKKYHDKIFEAFQRLHSKDKYAGTGIGLSTCYKIIQEHDGEIWLDSKPGEGTTFYFTLSTE